MARLLCAVASKSGKMSRNMSLFNQLRRLYPNPKKGSYSRKRRV